MPVFQVFTFLGCRSGQAAVSAAMTLLAGVAVASNVGYGLKDKQANGSDYPVRIQFAIDQPNYPLRIQFAMNRRDTAPQRAYEFSDDGSIRPGMAAEQVPIRFDKQVSQRVEPSRTNGFVDAFKGFAGPSVISRPESLAFGAARGSMPVKHGFIQNNFKLQELHSPGGRISQKKRFVLNEVVLGRISLQFSSSSVIYLSASEFLGVFDGKVPRDIYKKVETMSSRSDVVTFDDLRTSGFDVRYDPVNDNVVVKI